MRLFLRYSRSLVTPVMFNVFLTEVMRNLRPTNCTYMYVCNTTLKVGAIVCAYTGIFPVNCAFFAVKQVKNHFGQIDDSKQQEQ